MTEFSRYIFMVGALPLLFLGALHALETPLTLAKPKGLSPRNPALGETMARETALITRRTNMWLAWVGFNLSHSLGIILLGVVVCLVGRSPASFQAQASFFVPLTIVASGLYLVIGFLYWFRAPIIGIALSAACFATSWAFLVMGD
jgi:hypothetical protein